MAATSIVEAPEDWTGPLDSLETGDLDEYSADPKHRRTKIASQTSGNPGKSCWSRRKR